MPSGDWSMSDSAINNYIDWTYSVKINLVYTVSNFTHNWFSRSLILINAGSFIIAFMLSESTFVAKYLLISSTTLGYRDDPSLEFDH
jgi:hypothetical protein